MTKVEGPKVAEVTRVRMVGGFLVRGFGVRALLLAGAIVSSGTSAFAQTTLDADELARAGSAVRTAFAFLYALPSDTAGAKMDSWVLDTDATTPTGEPSGRWRILASKLTDTGQDLPLADLLRDGGTSPAQLAASMAAVQRLEGKVSKAEAEAAIEVVVTINEPEPAVSLSDEARRTRPSIAGARVATRIRGDWIRHDDRELEMKSERWSPARLIVGFGARRAVDAERAARAIHSVAITAQGNEEMIDRLIRETNWDSLAALTR